MGVATGHFVSSTTIRYWRAAMVFDPLSAAFSVTHYGRDGDEAQLKRARVREIPLGSESRLPQWSRSEAAEADCGRKPRPEIVYLARND
jgi:hypothetical protein